MITKHILLIQVLSKNRLIKASHYDIPESSSLPGQCKPNRAAVDSQTEKALWQPLCQMPHKSRFVRHDSFQNALLCVCTSVSQSFRFDRQDRLAENAMTSKPKVCKY